MVLVRVGVLVTVILWSLFAQVIYCNILTIEERPANGKLEVLERSTLKLTCLVPTSQILDRLYWFIPSREDIHVTNKNVEKSPYIQVDNTIPPRVALYVRDFKSYDTGPYSCRFYDRRDASTRRLVAEQTVQISLVSDIQIVTAEREQWLKNDGSNALIRCQLRGNPPPRIVWVRNSKVIETNRKYSYTNTGLQLTKINWNDAGKYICRAVRDGVSKALDVFIDVRVFQTPTITLPPTVVYPMVLTEGREAYIDCKGEGKPKPKIFWFKQKEPNRMLQQVDPQRYFVDENTGRLRIFNVKYVADTDTFICVAALTSSAIVQNVQDMMTRKTTHLQVHLWPTFFHVDRPMHAWVRRGQTGRVVCSVKATGNIRIQFQKLYAPFPFENGVQRDDDRITITQTVEETNPLNHYLTMEIKNTKSSDSSNYTCIATNQAGNSSWNATLSVEHKPEMLTNMSKISMGWIRNTTNLTCISYGLPHPTWSWYRHGIVPVLNGINRTFHVFSYDYDRHSQSWLQIRPDFGMERWIFDEYQCIATNKDGTGNVTTIFQAASVPGSPVVTYVNVTSSSIAIMVNPPKLDGGMPVLYYMAQYRAQGNAQRSWYGPVEFPAKYKVEFAGLMADTEYTFEISARNLVGPSQSPAVVQKRTLALRPPSIVEVISEKVSTYPYTYFVRWKVPHNGGEPIDGYRIRVRKVGTNNWNEYRPLFNNPNLSEYFMVDLEAATKYQLNIQAHSIKGYGPDSYFDFQTPKADLEGKPDRMRGGGNSLQAKSTLFLAIAAVLVVHRV